MHSLLPGLMPAILSNTTFINNLLLDPSVAVPSLSPIEQNGNAVFGALPQYEFAPFLGSLPPDQYPWGNYTVEGTDSSTVTPDTGVTRYYDLHVSRGVLAPDGVEKEMILINGQFPGPMIEANWGDWFEITVHNEITNPEEGTAMHWHGLLQKKTPDMDGVPGNTQCPIAPGASMTYRFQADLYGTSWYHAHYSAQYADGILGPMIIHGPSSASYDIDLGPIFVSDFYYQGYRELLDSVMSTDPSRALQTVSNTTLIQGKMSNDCANITDGRKCTPNAGIAKFQFTSGKTHRLRIINPSAAAVIVVSIDSHVMTVIANDFIPVVPYNKTTITLSAGQRMDVLVTADQEWDSPDRNGHDWHDSNWRRSDWESAERKAPGGAFYMRARQPPDCSPSYQPFALAAIYYDDVYDTNAAPTSLPQDDFITVEATDCSNDPLTLTVPSYAIPAVNPDITLEIDIAIQPNETGYYIYYTNNQTFRANYNWPTHLLAENGNFSFIDDPIRNVYDLGEAWSTWIIFKNTSPYIHPMHSHGQNMYVLDEGVGDWNGTVVRPENPQRRDVQILQPGGYLALQLLSDNPGLWPLHCHFAWHVSQGLYVNFVQKKNEVVNPAVQDALSTPTCQSWWAYTNNTIVDQIDSGEKMRV